MNDITTILDLEDSSITNFFQLPQETLKFQPSIFWHCENAGKKASRSRMDIIAIFSW